MRRAATIAVVTMATAVAAHLKMVLSSPPETVA